MKKIKIGIVGYGNVGKGAAIAVRANPDMELVAIFTRRNPESIVPPNNSVAVLPIDDVQSMVGKIDVMLLCGGSAKDLPEQGPYFASMFNTVDSYDTHAKIPEYLEKINEAAKKTIAIISTGWDPGLFSMMRVLFESTIPEGNNYTFWGKGFSQGHSDAIRQISGVKYAAQYSIPIDSAIDAIRRGERPVLTPRQKIKRECFVVAEHDADLPKIENVIKSMPHYFADYDTTVDFIDTDEFIKNHSQMPHGGMVMHSGNTGEGIDTHKQFMEFSLKLDSNPEFTGSIIAMYARAAYRMAQEGSYGAKTVFDVPLSYVSIKDRAVLIKELL